VAVYSIKDVEKLTGIKAHTIRAWEQRYDILTPKRTDTNIRYYQDDDLKVLINIALLNKNGIKISKIAQMSEEEIAENVALYSEVSGAYHAQVDALTLSMMELDELKFDRIMSANTQQIGFERTMLEVIFPFLDKLSLLWLTGSINPVQENFISYLIRQKIIVAIDELPIAPKETGKQFMIYLPEGEKQELSLLFMLYLLKSRKLPTIYLGQGITVDDLEDAYRIHKPDYIFTLITETFARESVQLYLNRLQHVLPGVRILVSGYQVIAQQIESQGNIEALEGLAEVLHFIDHLPPTPSRSKTASSLMANGRN
jgi:DNA-binding transcriptional MerR regulator